MSATAFSGTVPPLAVGTGRFSSVAKSRRAPSTMLTRIGIWRLLSENLAAFCGMSPMVAMRIVWPMLATETPSSAARSSRGRTTIAGRCRSPSMRGSRSSSSPRISATARSAAFCSAAGSEPVRNSEIGRPAPPEPPVKVRRASGTAASSGNTAFSHSFCVTLRCSRGTSVM